MKRTLKTRLGNFTFETKDELIKMLSEEIEGEKEYLRELENPYYIKGSADAIFHVSMLINMLDERTIEDAVDASNEYYSSEELGLELL